MLIPDILHSWHSMLIAGMCKLCEAVKIIGNTACLFILTRTYYRYKLSNINLTKAHIESGMSAWLTQTAPCSLVCYFKIMIQIENLMK